jgi:hypothetical protein
VAWFCEDVPGDIGWWTLLVAPETFKPILRQRSVPCSILNISMSEVRLKCASHQEWRSISVSQSLGGADFAAFFSHPALIALTVTTILLSGVALFSGGNLSPGIREDRSNRWVIGAFGPYWVACGLPAYTDRIGFWTLDGDAIRWLLQDTSCRCFELQTRKSIGPLLQRLRM